MVRARQGIGTQTIVEPVTNGETQTEWGLQEAGTQVVVGQTTKWTQTLQGGSPGDSNLQARLEAVELPRRKAEAQFREVARSWEATERKCASLEE
ncbi:unnamed protein product [Caretta caretta]